MYSYKKHILLPLLLGMISGSLLFILLYDQFSSSDTLSNIYNISLTEVNNSSYVIYLIRQRVILLVVFIIAVVLVSYKFASILFNYTIGIYYGIMASLLFVEYGYSSYKISVFFLLQGILYYISMYIAGAMFVGDKYSNSVIINKSNNFNCFVKIVLIIVLLLLSVVCEIFF